MTAQEFKIRYMGFRYMGFWCPPPHDPSPMGCFCYVSMQEGPPKTPDATATPKPHILNVRFSNHASRRPPFRTHPPQTGFFIHFLAGLFCCFHRLLPHTHYILYQTELPYWIADAPNAWQVIAAHAVTRCYDSSWC